MNNRWGQYLGQSEHHVEKYVIPVITQRMGSDMQCGVIECLLVPSQHMAKGHQYADHAVDARDIGLLITA